MFYGTQNKIKTKKGTITSHSPPPPLGRRGAGGGGAVVRCGGRVGGPRARRRRPPLPRLPRRSHKGSATPPSLASCSPSPPSPLHIFNPLPHSHFSLPPSSSPFKLLSLPPRDLPDSLLHATLPCPPMFFAVFGLADGTAFPDPSKCELRSLVTAQPPCPAGAMVSHFTTPSRQPSAAASLPS